MSYHDISSGLKIKLSPDEARDSARVQQDIMRLSDFLRTEVVDAAELGWLQVRVKSLSAVMQTAQIPQTLQPEKPVKGRAGRLTAESKALLGFISEDFVLLTRGSKTCAYHKETGGEQSKEGFELYCAQHYGDLTMHADDGGELHMSSGVLWWKWNDPSRRVVRDLVVEPTHLPESEDPAMQGGQVCNLWHVYKKLMVAPDPAATEESVRVYLDHLAYLADGDAPTVQFVLCWLAHLYQRPGFKMPSALAFVSEAHGVGKNLFTQILSNVFGAKLYARMGGTQLRKGFTDAVEGKLICEVSELSAADTRVAAEKLKGWITDHETDYESKGRAARTGKNISHFIFHTNNLDALQIGKEDRRFAVIRCTAPPKPTAYYDALWAWVNGPGPALLAGYLAKFEFPADWKPGAAPPMTEAKRAVQEASRSPQADAIASRIADRLPPFDRDLGFLGDRRDPKSGNEARGVVERLNDLGLNCSFNAKNLSTALRQCGAVPLKKGTAAWQIAWCWRSDMKAYWDGRSLDEWTAHMYRGEVPDDYAAWVAAHGSKGDE